MYLMLSIVLFLVSGYLLTLCFSRIQGFFERAGFGIALGVSLLVLESVLFVALGIPLASLVVFQGVLVFVLGFFLRRRLGVVLSEWSGLERRERWLFAALVLVACAAGLFVLFPHMGYGWPIHADEWWQVGVVENVLEGKGLNVNPYTFDAFPNHKPGFGSSLAGLFGASGLDPVEDWSYLPGVNVFLIALAGSLLLYSRTKSFLGSGLLPLFFVVLRPNAYTLGWWFLVPSMFGLFFVVVLFLTFERVRESWKGILLWLVFLLALIFVYAPFAAFSLLVFVPMILWKRKKTGAVIFGMLVFLGILLAVSVSPYSAYWGGERGILQALFVPDSATVHFAEGAGFFDVVTIPLFVLGVFGFFSAWRERWMRGVLYGVLLGGAGLLVSGIWGVSFLMFEGRLIYVVGVLLGVLASHCFIYMWRSFRDFWEREKMPAFWRGVVVLFLIPGISLFLLQGYFVLPEGTDLYYLVNDEDVAGLEWLRENAEEGTVVVGDKAVGTLVTPFTRLASKISFLTGQSVSREHPEDAMLGDVEECSVKQEGMERLGGDVLYARRAQDCGFFEEMYSSERVYIYKYAQGK